MEFEKIEIAESEQLIADFTEGLNYKRNGEWYVPVPRRWLQAGSWTAKEALLLFANVEPQNATFQIKQFHDIDYTIHLHTCKFLGQDAWIGGASAVHSLDELGKTEKKLSRTIKEAYPDFYLNVSSGENRLANQWVEENPSKIEAIKYFEVCSLIDRYSSMSVVFSRLYHYWNHRIDARPQFDENERHSVGYFIEWVKKCYYRASVSWLHDAEEEGLLKGLQADKEEYVNTTVQNYILAADHANQNSKNSFLSDGNNHMNLAAQGGSGRHFEVDKKPLKTISHCDENIDNAPINYLNGMADIEDFFRPAVWNTIKKWVEQYGLEAPPKNETWRLSLSDARSIKKEHENYYKNKKKI